MQTKYAIRHKETGLYSIGWGNKWTEDFSRARLFLRLGDANSHITRVKRDSKRFTIGFFPYTNIELVEIQVVFKVVGSHPAKE